MEVLHRVASMASGGMDTLPHNGAVITLLAVTGLSHRQSYKDIFAITVIKTLSVFVVIALVLSHRLGLTPPRRRRLPTPANLAQASACRRRAAERDGRRRQRPLAPALRASRAFRERPATS